MAISRWLLAVVALLPITGRSEVATGPDAQVSIAPLKIVAGVLTVVPVKVNGAGPFDFVLDTGSSATTIDSDLAARLGLPITGQAISVTPQKSSVILIALAHKLEVANATVEDLNLSVDPLRGVKAIYPAARGILGEDFLRNFDFLLDNRHHALRLERGPAAMAETLIGEHVPLTTQQNNSAQSIPNRLILIVKLPQLKSPSSSEDITVLLDSAASTLTLFGITFQGQQNSYASDGPMMMLAQGDSSRVEERQAKALVIGQTVLRNVSVVTTAPSQTQDAEGLLPTSIFHSIYISHSGRYAIFNPVAKPTRP